MVARAGHPQFVHFLTLLFISKLRIFILISNMGYTHLFVLISGLDGFAADLLFFHNRLAAFPHILPLSPTVNHYKTRDGINGGAQRILSYIEPIIKLNPSLCKISFIGHSLGGIYARQIIHLMQSSFGSIKLCNYVSLVSPHVGSRQHAKLIGNFLISCIPQLFGQTGRELFLVDSDHFMLQLADQEHINRLAAFDNLMTYANCFNDFSVHYSTAAMRKRNAFRNKSYPHGSILLDEELGDVKRSATINNLIVKDKLMIPRRVHHLMT